MPGFDGTGPDGRGSFSGRGRGFRWWQRNKDSDQNVPLSDRTIANSPGIGRGGYPGGRGLGRGQGGGRGRNQFSPGSGRR